MKKSLFNIVSILTIALFVASCNDAAKMAKYASLVKSECTPEVLECVANEITATYSLTFPEKYFAKNAVLEVTPVLVYDGGTVAAPVHKIQGEKVLENNTVIYRTPGGAVKNTVTFQYVPGMEKATLELRAVVKANGKEYAIPTAYKLADGTNCTYMLVCTDALKNGGASVAKDNYQDILKETKEAQIKYLINNSTVRSNQLTTAEIKEFKAFLKEVENDAKRTVVSNDIIAYASPDGNYDLNDKLSQNRAKTAEKAFNKKVAKGFGAPVNVSQVAEDWEGFKELVEASNIEDKDLILRVLSMYSDPAVREREIKNMSAVFTSLKDKVLPELRRARFIANIDVQNRTDKELLEAIENNDIVLDEESLLKAATLVDNTDTKIALYKKAAELYNSDRANNNLAVEYLKAGKAAEAKAALNKMANKDEMYYNNLGIAELQSKNYEAASAAFAKANTPAAKANNAAILILNGKYSEAAAALAGTKSFNEALANVLVNNTAKAESILAGRKCEKSAYLRAVVNARNGKNDAAKKELSSVTGKLAERAAKDIEFAKL